MTIETIEMKEVVVDGVTKYTISFPLTDEAGEPILDRQMRPRMTNLIADSPGELAIKAARTNLEVSRTLERANRHIESLKKRATPARTRVNLKPAAMTEEEKVQLGLDVQDPRKAADAIQKVVESRVSPVAGEVERQGEETERERRLRIAGQFITLHRHDYYNVEANGLALRGYIERNGLEYDLDNLEIAFAAMQDQLAQRPAPAAPRNDPPPDPGNAPAAPGNDPPNPGTPSSQPRGAAPVGGISDRQASGRPAGAPGTPILTRVEAYNMLYNNRPEYERWMKDPRLNAILTAALAGR
jgi:hypothetical protein